jgi:hypothetical protein
MTDPADVGDLVEQISNADVAWDGSQLGLTPTVLSPAAGRLVRHGPAAARALIALMSDPDRFVAAHVILTLASGVAYSAFPEWNGLVVKLGADGVVEIDADQRFAMADRWQRWYDTTPHPRYLPGVA